MDKKFNFGTYVPKAFRELATEEERIFSEWVINFKDGQKAQLKEGAQMVINKLRQWYGDKARELVVVPVPCSSMAQYRYRFAYFCVVVANTLGQLNPMQHVTILGKRTAAHRNPAHTVQEDNYQVQIDAAFFKGKKVVVVDDIVSSGRTADAPTPSPKHRHTAGGKESLHIPLAESRKVAAERRAVGAMLPAGRGALRNPKILIHCLLGFWGPVLAFGCGISAQKRQFHTRLSCQKVPLSNKIG